MTKFSATIKLAFVALAATIIHARAQQVPLARNIPMADPIAAADNEYGRAVRQVLVEGLLANTDASCRKTEALDDEALSRRLRDIFIVHGTMWNGHLWWTLLLPEFPKAFARRAGDGGLAEWQQLLSQSGIRELAAMQAAVRNNELTNAIVENTRRWMILRRAPRNIASSWGALPENADLQRIRDSEDQAAAKAVDAILQSDGGAKGKRYLELSQLYLEARVEALKTGVTGLFSIGEIFPGLSARLRSLCIPVPN